MPSLGLTRVLQLCVSLLIFSISIVDAYRPTQHCKHIGEAGHYSACTSITTFDNKTSGHPDLYLRYHWFRYDSSNKGWHAFALGEKMAGAHMLVMYGDPKSPDQKMTVSVRTADGHHPPLPIEKFSRFEGYYVPEVEVITSKFEEYTGPFVHKKLNKKPSHIGVMEVIIYSFGLWPGQALDDASDRQPMIWSSNGDQDFQGDFAVGRSIEAHAFGLGFGPLYTDLKNSRTPQPMFGDIDELGGLKGTNEIQQPNPPTKTELEAGDAFIASIVSPGDSVAHEHAEQHGTNPFDAHGTSSEANEKGDDQPVEQPAKTVLGKTLRDWMWHLHGVLMCFSFLGLYPLGIYLLRRPPPSASNGFNNHWTIQSLSTVSLLIGASIAYINSRGISIWHQYIGIFMVALVGAQIFMGWRHHVIYIATKQRTRYSTIHVWAGRFIMPLGFWNIMTGMLLRQYGWFTMVLVFALIVLESVFLIFALRTAGNARIDGGSSAAREQGVALRDEEAEEYFQLAGEDDDEWSDDGTGSAPNASDGATKRQDEKRKQAERLAKLDKV